MATLNIGVGNRDRRGDVRIDTRKTSNINCLADARSLPFRSGSFSFIICEHVLEHLQEDSAYRVYDQTKALKYFSQHPWFIGFNSEFTFLAKK